VFLAITFGLWGANLISGLANGMIQGQIDSAINNELAHLIVQEKHYPQQEELKYNYDRQLVEAKLNLLEDSITFCHHQLVTCMLSSAGYTQGLTLVGIDPKQEKKVVTIYDHLEEGNYFDSTVTSGLPILISEKTAKELKVKLNAKLVANFPDIENDVVYGLFRVVGIYKSNNQLYDQMHAFVVGKDLSKLLKMDADLVHETLVKKIIQPNEEVKVNELKSDVQNELKEFSVQTWEEIRPELVLGQNSMKIFLYVILGIVMIALVFVIVNSMLMVILERTHELGTLRALGMNSQKIIIMIFYETVIQGMIGAVLGTTLSYIVISYFNRYGLQFSSVSEGMEAYGYPSIFYPYLNGEAYVISLLMVFITTLFSAIPPVRRALSLNPSSAIRSI